MQYIWQNEKYLKQKVETVKRWYQQAEIITWSRLATFGNNPLVKLTILTPLLAQVLIHKGTIEFLERYEFKNIEYMYASLMCFFFAQLIYMFRCHREIKDYPSEVRYTQALDATTPDEDLNIELFDQYKVFFKKYGGDIDESKFDVEAYKAEVIYSTPDEEFKSVLHFQSSEQYSTLVQVQNVVGSLEDDEQHGVIDWELLRKGSYPSLNRILNLDDDIKSDEEFAAKNYQLIMLEHWIDSSAIGSHWRAKALKRRYDKLNTSNLLSRSIAAVLYCLGSLYFIYTGGMNIYRVLDTYGWITELQQIWIRLNSFN